MTRFTATTAADRVALIADAVVAHRQRGSPYLTAAAATAPPDAAVPAWVQYRARDGRFNTDCQSDELDRLIGYLEGYPSFTIVARQQPEDTDGTNVHIEGYGDDERLAQFVEGMFTEVFAYDVDYRLWISEV